MDSLFLHGFFGLPNDWKSLSLKEKLPGNSLYHDLFASIDEVAPFDSWAERFNRKVKRGTLLVGYSLGGRLALHAALQRPELYRALVLVSAHYGLKEEKERLERRKNDEIWADKIENMGWEQLVSDWNRQPPFLGDPSPNPMNEADFSRDVLAQAMRRWSLGNQENLKRELEELPLPVLYVAGANDAKFAQLAKALRFKEPRSNIWIAPESAHRVPWRQSKKFTLQFLNFVQRVDRGEIYVERDETNRVASPQRV